MLFYDNNKWVNESRQLLEADSITKKRDEQTVFPDGSTQNCL